MKKAFSLVAMAAIVSFSMTACGGGEEESTDAESIGDALEQLGAEAENAIEELVEETTALVEEVTTEMDSTATEEVEEVMDDEAAE